MCPFCTPAGAIRVLTHCTPRRCTEKINTFRLLSVCCCCHFFEIWKARSFLIFCTIKHFGYDTNLDFIISNLLQQAKTKIRLLHANSRRFLFLDSLFPKNLIPSFLIFYFTYQNHSNNKIPIAILHFLKPVKSPSFQ